jgi:hypothetical protein
LALEAGFLAVGDAQSLAQNEYKVAILRALVTRAVIEANK